MPEISLPTLHESQYAIAVAPDRFKGLLCGRRWGKTEFFISRACTIAVLGRFYGYFVPDYKVMSEMFEECDERLSPIIKNSSKHDGVIRLKNKGRIDFWTLNNPKAGRSRKYHEVGIDEAAHTDRDMMSLWQKNIRPTLVDYSGDAVIGSTPAGADEENFFWRVCNEPEHGFKVFHAPTHSNPLLPKEELDRLQSENMPEVYAQEFLAQFVNWSGICFFPEAQLLDNGRPVELSWRPSYIFAILDTASKDGTDHDGTGLIIFAKSDYTGVPLLVLDYEVVQIEGGFLINWLPEIEQRMERLAEQYNARHGNAGILIEDKDAGIMLNQTCPELGYKTSPIDSKVTSIGKKGRAVAASPHVFRDKVKLSPYAYDKTILYRGQQKNHLLSQVTGFRLSDVDTRKHNLDLLDCFTYGSLMALGNAEGF